MKRNISVGLICGIFLLALSVSSFINREAYAGEGPMMQGAKENINFKWTFAAKVGEGAQRRVVTVAHDTILRTGDEVKFFVRLMKPGYVYIIQKDSKNEISLQFPSSLETALDVEKNYYLPKEKLVWFKLDKNTGSEVFYILASQERLVELETALRSYLFAKKPENANAVVAEIKEIKKKFRTFGTLAERPISIAGNVRGAKQAVDHERVDIAAMATEISAENFFSKTITIDHR